MNSHTLPMTIAYLFAAILLSVYGTEVCPYIEGIGFYSTLPVFFTAFGLCLIIRQHIFRTQEYAPATALRVELMLWVTAGGLVYVINALFYNFPVGSGLKVLAGTIAIGLPMACYFGLLIEADHILSARNPHQRAHPSGPKRSIPAHLYRFVFSSQVFLGLVVLLLVLKDLSYLTQTTAYDINALVVTISIEVIGSFCVLLAANALVANQYAKNLKLLLTQQLEQMDKVAQGDLNALVPVVSNDEIGQIGDRTNSMISSLRDRERVKTIFGKLVSPEVAQHLLNDDSNQDLGGQQINGVVLFTDIRDFTSLSETCEPYQIVNMLNEYFSMLVEAVHAEGGVLDKFIGDAAMAIFGLNPSESATSANDAAYRAAKRIRAGLSTVNTSLSKKGLPPIDTGFGIHFGAMVAGNIGSVDRMEFTVIGDAVNVASRLEGLCKTTGKWLSLSSASFECLSHAHQTQLADMGEFPIKGKQQSVKVYGPV